MLSKCFTCGGTVKQQQTSLDFWWGEKLVIFEDVPAMVCTQCGDKFVAREVYGEMENMAQGEDNTTERINVGVISYPEKASA